jgi:cell wall assembly regulator SMI1
METPDLEQSWSDILEWFEDAGLAKNAANLRGPATQDAIKRAERLIGTAMPPGLKWLYERHNGARDYEIYPLFRWLTFLPLDRLEDERESMLFVQFGVVRGGSLVDPDAIYDKPENPLRDEEKTAKWWPFANSGGDWFAVHGVTGRVIWILKGDFPPIDVVAESFEQFMADYADGLWNDRFTICGDPAEPPVEEPGMIAYKAYVH